MLPFNKPKFDRLIAVCNSLEDIYKEKYKDDKRVNFYVRHETLESTYRPNIRRYRLWVEAKNDTGVTDFVQGQIEDTTPSAYIMTEDEFEDLIFYELEDKLITELIKRFYDKIFNE